MWVPQMSTWHEEALMVFRLQHKIINKSTIHREVIGQMPYNLGSFVFIAMFVLISITAELFVYIYFRMRNQNTKVWWTFIPSTLEHTNAFMFVVNKRLNSKDHNDWDWLISTATNKMFSIDSTELRYIHFCMRQIVDEFYHKNMGVSCQLPHGKTWTLLSSVTIRCCCVCKTRSRKIVDYNAFRFILRARCTPCLQCTHIQVL